MEKDNLKQILKKVTNEKNIVSNLEQLRVTMGNGYEPDLLISPETVEEMATVIKLANKHKVPVYPLGSGSRFMQGVAPFKGGLLLSTINLDNIVEYRPDNMSVEVEVGITNNKLKEKLAQDNIFYPMETDNNNSTIGGQIATDRYGRKKYLYKSTRYYVMGMEFISPQGEIIRVGGRTVKNVSGYDISQLLAGSWGNFGIITKATLRVRPIPEKNLILELMADDFTNLIDLISSILKEKISLASLNFEQVDSNYWLYLELEGFSETLKLQSESLKKKFAFQDVETKNFNSEVYPGKISLPLENYCQGLKALFQLSLDEQILFKFKGNPTSGIIEFIDNLANEEVLIKIADIIKRLNGTFVYQNRTLTQKKRGAGYLGLVQAIKRKVDPNNIFVPQSYALKG